MQATPHAGIAQSACSAHKAREAMWPSEELKRYTGHFQPRTRARWAACCAAAAPACTAGPTPAACACSSAIVRGGQPGCDTAAALAAPIYVAAGSSSASSCSACSASAAATRSSSRCTPRSTKPSTGCSRGRQGGRRGGGGGGAKRRFRVGKRFADPLHTHLNSKQAMGGGRAAGSNCSRALGLGEAGRAGESRRGAGSRASRRSTAPCAPPRGTMRSPCAPCWRPPLAQPAGRQRRMPARRAQQDLHQEPKETVHQALQGQQCEASRYCELYNASQRGGTPAHARPANRQRPCCCGVGAEPQHMPFQLPCHVLTSKLARWSPFSDRLRLTARGLAALGVDE